MIPFDQLHLAPIFITTAVLMIFGMVWYSQAVFGRLWMQLSGITEEQMVKADMKKAFATGILATLIHVYFLYLVLLLTGVGELSEILMTVLVVWMATIVPSELHGVAWEQRPFMLLLINAANALINMFIAGWIYSLWM